MMKKYDLAGLWQVYLDAEMKNDTIPLSANQEIYLPGTTSAAGLGVKNTRKEMNHLTDICPFEGNAWFIRQFEADGWQDRQVVLTLERTRMTTVYVDGRLLGHCQSLCTPHRYVMPPLSDGSHTLTVCVTNTGYPVKGGHLTSPDTQSNWNGITGEISLTVGKTILNNIRVYPSADLQSLQVFADVIGPQEGTVAVSVKEGPAVIWNYSSGRIMETYRLPENLEQWDELTPVTHILNLAVGEDCYSVTFGLRRFRAEGRRLKCGGRELFLRGKHDALLFPLTGYTPCDVDSWKRTMTAAMEYGINHYRFHTCCPPDAAFTVADELGFFMEPELPFWGTVADECDEKYNEKAHSFLRDEGYRILKEYGHHPSFVMLSLGNELWGSKKVLNRMISDYRVYDPDKLYVSGSNNFQFAPDILSEEDVFVNVRFSRNRLFRGSYAMCDAPQGIVQVTEPESVSNYDDMIVPEKTGNERSSGKRLVQHGMTVKEVEAESSSELIPQIPVIAHEVGQYEFYPDFDEIKQYTGPLKAGNLELFRERVINSGLYPMRKEYFMAAGKLAVDCYRREIETMLRTKELAGFQLLDIQDYSGQGTALVGVLNAFMKPKGLISPEKWRQFCAGTVILGGFKRFVLQRDEDVEFTVTVSECDPRKKHEMVCCSLYRGNKLLAEKNVPLGEKQGRLTKPVSVNLGSFRIEKPEKWVVRLTLTDGTENEYPLWVFPRVDVEITQEGITAGHRGIRFVPDADTARATQGKTIIVPDAADKLSAEYCTDFWCYPMFRSISERIGKPVPVGTMGLYIQKEDPLLSGFPTEEYTTPPWYQILRHAHCEVLDSHDEPVVEMIDNVDRCYRLGILYRRDGYLYLTARLWEMPDAPEIKALALSLLFANG